MIIDTTIEMNNINKSILYYEMKQKEYQNMRNSVSDAVNKLASAKSNIQKSRDELVDAYNSETALNKVKELDDINIEVNEITNELNATILGEIDNQLKNINNNLNSLYNKKNKFSKIFY